MGSPSRNLFGILLAVLPLSALASTQIIISKSSLLGPLPNQKHTFCTSLSKAWDPGSHHLEEKYLVAKFVRGGATSAGEPNQSKQTQTTIVTVAAVAFTVVLGWLYREQWMHLFDKEFLLTKTLKILNDLDSLPKIQSYTTYALGMAVWEALGLSTIPVETAAGMVFGWNGFWLSGIGKLMGAVLAFCLARYGFFASWIQEKLSENTFLQLIQESATSNPLLVTVLLKCSCFPETIKNYGAGIIKPIQIWMFVLGTIAHGWTFSALWTYLGVDTAMRLEHSSPPADKLLQTLLSLALVNGVAVSPLAMAVWARNLQKVSKESPT